MAATRMVIGEDQMRAIRMWARRRAALKSHRARRVNELHMLGRSYEQTRIHLGLTVEEFRRAKLWMFDALAETSTHTTFEESLADHGERHVGRVMRLGRLRQDGAGEREIREHLGLSEREYDAVRGWWLDGLAATEPPGDETAD